MHYKSCQEEERPFVSLDKYRQVFNKFNLGIFKPQKDKRIKCLAYKEMIKGDNIKHQKGFEEYLIIKEQARNPRSKDKEESRKDEGLLCFNFNLQEDQLLKYSI